jgi:hypothetical protein
MTTITTEDVRLAASHETRLERQEMRPRWWHWWQVPWKVWRTRLLEWLVGAVLWGGLLMIASPLGQLLSAMWDTVQEMWRTR